MFSIQMMFLSDPDSSPPKPAHKIHTLNLKVIKPDPKTIEIEIYSVLVYHCSFQNKIMVLIYPNWI